MTLFNVLRNINLDASKIRTVTAPSSSVSSSVYTLPLSPNLVSVVNSAITSNLTQQENITSIVSISPDVVQTLDEAMSEATLPDTVRNTELPEISISPEVTREISVFQATAGPTPESPFFIPVIPTPPPIPVYQSRQFLSTSEISTGFRLENNEKPKIVATISIDANYGFPRKNLMFIKKLNSKRGYAEYYKIFRRKLFKEEEFQEIAHISLEEVPNLLPPAYTEIVSSMGYNLFELFSFEDSDLEENQVYIYKIFTKWNFGSSNQTTNLPDFLPNSFRNFDI